MENYCKQHEVNWFKSKNMKGYAHPIKDKNGETVFNPENGKALWCNRPQDFVEPEGSLVDEAVKLGGVVTGVTQKPRESGQELGMLLKELGENIRTGTLTKDKIAGEDSKGAIFLFKFYWKHLNDRIKYYQGLEEDNG